MLDVWWCGGHGVEEGSDCGVVDGVEYWHSYLRLESLACIYGK